MMRAIQLPAVLGLAGLLTASAAAEPVLTESFDRQGQWKKAIRGKGTVELVDGGVEGRCLKVSTADQAMVYYSIQLPLERVRGKRLVVRAKVKLDNVVVGPQTYSTAKLHVGVVVGKSVQNRAQRFVGTMDWHDQVLIAPVPADAERVVLDLGIQNGNGTAWFDDLVVDDGVKEHVPLNLKPAANAGFGGHTLDGCRFLDADGPDLRAIPVADVKLAGIDFYVMHGQENYGRTCIALRGAKRPNLPARTATVIPVAQKGSRLFFLQAAAGLDASRKAPCLACEVHYEDGTSAKIPMREGTDIGAFDEPKDLSNWKVAWTAKHGDATIGLGVTTWKNPRPGVPIAFIRLTTPGTGAVPVVVAVSLDPKGT